jgi:hypothetical protein
MVVPFLTDEKTLKVLERFLKVKAKAAVDVVPAARLTLKIPK